MPTHACQKCGKEFFAWSSIRKKCLDCKYPEKKKPGRKKIRVINIDYRDRKITVNISNIYTKRRGGIFWGFVKESSLKEESKNRIREILKISH